MSAPLATEILRTELANGLGIVLHPDPRLPLVALNLWYHVGSKNERPGRTGLAHLFEHMLFQGSEHVDTNGHFRHLQGVGGVANGSTWYDRTNYYETVPSSRLDLALWLESDRMGFLLPALTQGKLDNQREVVLNERRQRVDNQPYAKPYERLFELLLPAEHPYQWPVIGRAEDIAAATLQEVRDFFAAWYRPANAVLTLAGDFAPEHALERIEHWFGGLPGGPVPPRRHWPLPPLEGPIRATVEDEVQLPRVYCAFRTPAFGSAPWFAGALLTAALADGKTSPLYRDLVWDRQLAQEAGAYLYPTEEIGVLVAWATARPGVELERLTEALWGHLERAAAPPSSGDLRRALHNTLAALWSELESLDERADRLSMYATLCARPELAWSEADRYRALTPESIAEFGALHLRRQHGVELAVVPRSAPR